MTAGRVAHLVAIVVQTLVMATAVGKIDALSELGQVLAVLIPLALSLLAAALRQPIALTVGAGVSVLAAASAGLPTTSILLLSLMLLTQFVLVEDPAALDLGPMFVAAVAVSAASVALLVGADIVTDGLQGGPELAVVGLGSLAAAALVWARHDPDDSGH